MEKVFKCQLLMLKYKYLWQLTTLPNLHLCLSSNKACYTRQQRKHQEEFDGSNLINTHASDKLKAFKIIARL